MDNLFTLPADPPPGEHVTVLAQSAGFTVERIISRGDITPEGSWYDQDHDEWVIVLQGSGTVEDDQGRVSVLGPGDALFIPARRRHRVTATSAEPPCLWLAVHGTPHP